jgi:hypothetical protein
VSACLDVEDLLRLPVFAFQDAECARRNRVLFKVQRLILAKVKDSSVNNMRT